ncbi:hypothetical protein [Pseudomonas sp. NFX224]|uniref:hypothetical protein n=1 Tax=Pseudomonas sp. NFX224 TaxID=3402862 RepID=UPI003AFA61F4
MSFFTSAQKFSSATSRRWVKRAFSTDAPRYWATELAFSRRRISAVPISSSPTAKAIKPSRPG